ncbi:MAG: ATP synthase F1 subunit delta [Kofleriaceae bacterium]|nr:ATP synthase F1 subunit delta [Kofleriaceae bacterium]MCL4226434.1 ATP synthase F1 subunit delta [Myxococcales bacterium]
MQAGSLARRYAKALMGLATDKKAVDKVGADLRALAAAFKVSPELGQVLGSTSHPRAARRKVVDALCARLAAHELVKTFCYLLLDKERLVALPDISREIDQMIEARAGKVQAEVVSAVPLTPAQLQQITRTLEQLSGKQVVVEKKHDPALLGGVVARVGDVVYDGSLRTQLRALRDQLSK